MFSETWNKYMPLKDNKKKNKKRGRPKKDKVKNSNKKLEVRNSKTLTLVTAKPYILDKIKLNKREAKKERKRAKDFRVEPSDKKP